MAERPVIDEIRCFEEFWWRFTNYSQASLQHTEQERQLALMVWLARAIDEERDLRVEQLVSKLARHGVNTDERRR